MGIEETVEELEHLEHERSAFDRQVAMSMAIVAAALACVTMLSHRAHNETLRLQGEANRLQTEANILHTRASDEWNFYQAKNIRNTQTQGFFSLLDVLTKESGPASERAQALRRDWTTQIEKYEAELPALKGEAQSLVEKARELEHEGGERLEQSHHTHRRGDRFDLAELGVELALVLCSLAVLTKRRSFWLGGIGFGLVGLAVAGVGLLS